MSQITVESFLRDVGIVKYIHDSYYDFITRLIVDHVNFSDPIIITIPTEQDFLIEVYTKLSNPILHTAQYIENDVVTHNITPNECRLRKITYNGPLYVTANVIITYIKDGKKTVEYNNTEKLLLCDMPIMVQSKFCCVNPINKIKMKECEYDYGGYFIINGSERIVVAQERMTHNEIYIFPNKEDYLKAEIKSNDPNNKLLTSFFLYHMYNKRSAHKIIRAEIQFLKKDLSLIILLKALGLEAIDDILFLICGDDEELRSEMVGTLEDECDITRQEALIMISKQTVQGQVNVENNSAVTNKNIEIAKNILEKTLLPHLGNNLLLKAFFITKMAKKLLNTSLQRLDFDDRDHYGNKRVDLTGELLFLIFQRGFDIMYKKLQEEILRIGKKRLTGVNAIPSLSLVSLLNSDSITKQIIYALGTGNWGNTKTGASKTGVSQIAKRMNTMDLYSHLRRLVTPSGKNVTTSKPRQLHPSQIFIICPSESPEGQSCGFTKHLSFLTHVSHGYNSLILEEVVKELQIFPLEDYKKYDYKYGIIFINGKPIGFVDTSTAFTSLHNFKNQSIIPTDTSIIYDNKNNYIRIWTDSGRCSVPCYVVNSRREYKTIVPQEEDFLRLKNGELKWNDFVRMGYIEYLDAREMEQYIIAYSLDKLKEGKYEYTHCIIDPATIVGVNTSCNPFGNHQPSPRTTYEGGMAKQFMGVPSLAFKHQMETANHILWYPHKKFVKTHTHDMLKLDEVPTGHQCILAFVAYKSYNQEDGIILNKSAIDRGLFRSTYFKTYTDVENKGNNSYSEEQFQKSNDKSSHKLDGDGFIASGIRVRDGDNIIDKSLNSSDQKVKNSATKLHQIDSAIVDKTMISTTNKGQKIVRTGIRIMKTPELGDKFAIRFSQKGTVTMMYNQEDMPFTRDGISPDAIITIHCLNSRATVGMLMETLMGKCSAISGNMYYSTLFKDVDMESLKPILHSFGLSSSGKEVLYDGATGRRMDAEIFIGINTYERLKHLVSEKYQSRARGPTTMLTRQPTEGRSKGGSLRYGEMEYTVSLAQSTAAHLREKLFLNSDKYETWVCEICGLFAVYNKNTGSKRCNVCESEENISLVQIPYACKLLFQELMAMQIIPRIRVKK